MNHFGEIFNHLSSHTLLDVVDFHPLNKKQGTEPGAWILVDNKEYLAKAIPLYHLMKEKACMEFYSIFCKTPSIKIGTATRSIIVELFNYFADSAIAVEWANAFLNSNEIVFEKKKRYLLYLSQRLENFHELGTDYVDYIEEHQRLNTQGVTPPLYGMPTLLAVAKVLGDSDCIGGVGGNVGFVVQKNNMGTAWGEVIPIDVGFALNDLHLKPLPGQTPKDIRVANMRSLLIRYENMTLNEKEEYLRTLKLISALSIKQIHSLFHYPHLINKVLKNIHLLLDREQGVYSHELFS